MAAVTRHQHLALRPIVGFRLLSLLLSLTVSLLFFTFSFFRSSMTSSCCRCLGLHTGLVPIGLRLLLHSPLNCGLLQSSAYHTRHLILAPKFWGLSHMTCKEKNHRLLLSLLL